MDEVVKMFEDRLLGRPGSESWRELSRMLEGAPPWRQELDRRWAGREDWQRFIEWERNQNHEEERTKNGRPRRLREEQQPRPGG